MDVTPEQLVNQLRYALTYVAEPDDAAAQAFARAMGQWRLFPSGPDAYAGALTEAVRSGALPDPVLRDFGGRVLRYLAVGRPWAARPFTRLALIDWPWQKAPAAALVRTGMHGVSAGVWRTFDFLHRGDGVVAALVLRQRSGEVIALVVRPDRRTTALKVLEGDPDAAVTSFLELTGLPPEAILRPPSEQAASSDGSGAQEERELFRLFVAQGRLWRADTGIVFDTSQGVSLRGGPARAIYVMDSQGNLYASLVETIGEFHHSSLLAGKPVAGAGEIVVRKGSLVEISGRCPTYAVGDDELRTVLGALTDQGLSTQDIIVRLS